MNGHELALLSAGRCRACAELLPGGVLFTDVPCPRCEEPTLLGAAERDALGEALSTRSDSRFVLLAAAIVGANLLIGWFPVVSSLVAALSTAWTRFQIVRPITRLLSPSRRFVTVWTARIASGAFVATVLVANELLTLIPFVSAPAKSLVTIGLIVMVAYFNRRYALWQLARDRDAAPVLKREYLLLGLVLLGLIGSCAAISAALFYVLTYLDLIAGGLVA